MSALLNTTTALAATPVATAPGASDHRTLTIVLFLLLVAELLRNSGRFTLADQLAYRMRQRPVRTAAAVSTLGVSVFYLLAQMVGAGSLVALLLGVSSTVAKDLTIVLVGAL